MSDENENVDQVLDPADEAPQVDPEVEEDPEDPEVDEEVEDSAEAEPVEVEQGPKGRPLAHALKSPTHDDLNPAFRL